jgi:hypothetical protein
VGSLRCGLAAASPGMGISIRKEKHRLRVGTGWWALHCFSPT